MHVCTQPYTHNRHMHKSVRMHAYIQKSVKNGTRTHKQKHTYKYTTYLADYSEKASLISIYKHKYTNACICA
jgi:hypothetical protein